MKSVMIFGTCEYQGLWSINGITWKVINIQTELSNKQVIKEKITSAEALQLLTGKPLNKLFRHWCFIRLNLGR